MALRSFLPPCLSEGCQSLNGLSRTRRPILDSHKKDTLQGGCSCLSSLRDTPIEVEHLGTIAKSGSLDFLQRRAAWKGGRGEGAETLEAGGQGCIPSTPRAKERRTREHGGLGSWTSGGESDASKIIGQPRSEQRHRASCRDSMMFQ